MTHAQRLLPPMVVGLLLSACGNPSPEPLSNFAETAPPIGFDAQQLIPDMIHPVVAVDGEGRLHQAALSQTECWPVFVNEDGTFTRFPGTGVHAHELAMVAGAGQLHAVWVSQSRTRSLLYARFDPETHEGSVVALPHRDDVMFQPTLTVADDGEVFILYVEGTGARTPESKVMFLHGSLEAGFTSPARVLPDCCRANEVYDGAYNVNLSDVQLDANGALHVVYTWRTDGTSDTIGYATRTRGVWRLEARLENMDAWMRPGLALTDAGAHIVYRLAEEDRLQQVIVSRGAPSAPQTLYSGDQLDAFLVDQDASGRLHLFVQTRIPGPDRAPHTAAIEYVTPGASESLRVAEGLGYGGANLTRATGGMTVAPNGTVFLPYVEQQLIRERRDLGEQVRLMVGRPPRG